MDESQVSKMSVKQLKAVIHRAGLSTEGIIEKAELRELALEAQAKLANASGTPQENSSDFHERPIPQQERGTIPDEITEEKNDCTTTSEKHKALELAIERALAQCNEEDTEEKPPVEASCYICWDHDDKKPLKRSCACRGFCTGYVHTSCLIKAAEKAQDMSRWSKCKLCDTYYYGRVALELSRAQWRLLRDTEGTDYLTLGRLSKSELLENTEPEITASLRNKIISSFSQPNDFRKLYYQIEQAQELLDNNKPKEAIALLEEIYPYAVLEEPCFFTLRQGVFHVLIMSYGSIHNWEKSTTLARNLLDYVHTHFGSNSKESIFTMQLLSTCLRNLSPPDNLEESNSLIKQAYHLCVQTYGANHPDTMGLKQVHDAFLRAQRFVGTAPS